MAATANTTSVRPVARRKAVRGGCTVSVGVLLKSTKISYCETDDGGEEFGIFAGSFGKLGIEAWKLGPTDLPFEHGDFRVRAL